MSKGRGVSNLPREAGYGKRGWKRLVVPDGMLPRWAGRDKRGWDIVVVPAAMHGSVYECKVRNKIQVLVGQDYEMKVFVNPKVAELDEWEMPCGKRMRVHSPEDVDVDE